MSDKYDFISDFIFDYTFRVNLHPIKLTSRCYGEEGRSIIFLIAGVLLVRSGAWSDPLENSINVT